MHPIEHLRYVARARGADPLSLVCETASALSGLGHEPAAIVLAVRRIIQRHPTCGPLWWLCSHAVSAVDPIVALRACEAEIRSDSTTKFLCDAMPQGAVVCVVGWSSAVLRAIDSRQDVEVIVVESQSDGGAAVEQCDVVIMEALAAGPTEVLCNLGSHAVAEVARRLQKPVWLVAPCGTKLPSALWSAMIAGAGFNRDAANDASNIESVTDCDLLPINIFSRVISNTGISDDLSQPFVAECPPATELLRHSAM